MIGQSIIRQVFVGRFIIPVQDWINFKYVTLHLDKGPVLPVLGSIGLRRRGHITVIGEAGLSEDLSVGAARVTTEGDWGESGRDAL